MELLDMRDIAIIDAFPVYKSEKTVLNIGCGEGRIDYYLAKASYQVYATDVKRCETWQNRENLTFHEADIFDLASMPIPSAPLVICSQVLEHLEEYRIALIHLIALTGTRLIITVPYWNSFNSPDHLNHWGDKASEGFKDIHEFVELCDLFSVSISKILTKSQDIKTGSCNYLIVIDKRQRRQ